MKEYYFASPTSTAEKVGTTGRLFKKQVLPLGDWVDPLFPGERMTFSREFFEAMVDNFKKKVAGRVSVPDTHTDASIANKGEVVDLAVEDDGLYAYLDIRKQDAIEGIEDDTVFDVSAKFTDNYQDTKDGIWHGPALLHVALVNNPYIKKMNPFVALAEASHNQHGTAVRALSESQVNKEKPMTVTNTRDFPVEVKYTVDEEEQVKTLQPNEELEVPTDELGAEVQAQLDAAEAPAEDNGGDEEGKPKDDTTERQIDAAKKSNGENLSGVADQGAPGEGTENTEGQQPKNQELSDTARELAETKHKLAMRDIDDTYKDLLRAGKLVPAMEAPFKQLSEAVLGQSRQLSDGNTVSLSEALTSFVESMPRIVALDEENGKQDEGTQDKSPWQQLSDKQREGLQASGITEESYNANGGKNGLSVLDLTGKKDK